jgi:hypothetical protein
VLLIHWIVHKGEMRRRQIRWFFVKFITPLTTAHDSLFLYSKLVHYLQITGLPFSWDKQYCFIYAKRCLALKLKWKRKFFCAEDLVWKDFFFPNLTILALSLNLHLATIRCYIWRFTLEPTAAEPEVQNIF